MYGHRFHNQTTKCIRWRSIAYDVIFIVVDKLTKVAHLLLIKKTSLALGIARVFIKVIVILHGYPQRIILAIGCLVHFKVFEGFVHFNRYQTKYENVISSKLDG